MICKVTDSDKEQTELYSHCSHWTGDVKGLSTATLLFCTHSKSYAYIHIYISKRRAYGVHIHMYTKRYIYSSAILITTFPSDESTRSLLGESLETRMEP